jgi:hypothetical protein
MWRTGGSESERFRYPRGEIILGHRGVDLDGAQFETPAMRRAMVDLPAPLPPPIQ